MYKYSREVLSKGLIDEFTGLSEKLFKDAKHDWGGTYTLDPNIDGYMRLERSNMLRFFTYRKDDKPIGYALFLLLNSLQTKDQRQAVCHMIYIDPDERGMGLPFISWCEKQVEGLVDIIYYSVKPFADYSSLLKHLGHEVIEVNYGRRVDKVSERKIQ